MKGPPTNENTPSRSGNMLHALLQGPNQKRKPSIKSDCARFDAFVGRYYPAVYRFASRLSDDPGEAVLLTNAALNSIRKQPWCPRDEITLVRMLLKAVVRARFTTTA
jgi:hypothetical protein